MIWPVSRYRSFLPEISSGYGDLRAGGPHPGADIMFHDAAACRGYYGRYNACPYFIVPGLQAVSAAPGVVSSRYTDPHGHSVEIDHPTGAPNGGILRTVYRHLTDWHVSVGQSVAAGVALGELGYDTLQGGPVHLHFECWQFTGGSTNGWETTDPAPLLSGAGTVEVPLDSSSGWGLVLGLAALYGVAKWRRWL